MVERQTPRVSKIAAGEVAGVLGLEPVAGILILGGAATVVTGKVLDWLDCKRHTIRT
ncbi:MAG TPA: hypothetical protein VE860_08060 [Chthoniobacterales bacterium]|nr:hypothetical protein [Chthoniobacterales bacterium]